MHHIPVRQMMQHAVITIHPEALVADAAQLLEEHHLRRLPVVDSEGCLVGIITDADIREAEAASHSRSPYDPGAEEEWLAVGDVMVRDVVMIDAGATLGQLAVTLMTHKIGGVPVVESDPHQCNRLRLIGIVTETDIFRMIAEAWQADEQVGH
jgi:acetoin utilization protein AcuB